MTGRAAIHASVTFASWQTRIAIPSNHCLLATRSDLDRRMFLATLDEGSRKAGWRVHAYVLMGNHCHLLLETPEDNLVAGRVLELKVKKGREALGVPEERLRELPKGALEKQGLAW